MTVPDLAVEVSGLRASYDGREVLCGVELSVPAGTVLGLLGPNGAGKTTTVRVLSTLVRPDAGTVRVAGFDVLREPAEVRRRIGLTGQYAAVDELLSGRANLRLVGRLQHLGRARSAARADELLERFGLTAAADRSVGTYSGGMRRRLDLAASLVGSPSVLFVDEPTTGLDPTSRFALWRTVRDLVDDGTSVVLTTQYLEEADELADTVAILDHGRKIVEGTPAELKGLLGGERLVVTAHDERSAAAAADVLRSFARGPVEVDLRQAVVVAEVDDPMRALREVSAGLMERHVPVRSVTLRAPSLDEVFVHLTSERDALAPVA